MDAGSSPDSALRRKHRNQSTTGKDGGSVVAAEEEKERVEGEVTAPPVNTGTIDSTDAADTSSSTVTQLFDRLSSMAGNRVSSPDTAPESQEAGEALARDEAAPSSAPRKQPASESTPSGVSAEVGEAGKSGAGKAQGRLSHLFHFAKSPTSR